MELQFGKFCLFDVTIAADIRVGGQVVTVVSCHMDSVFWDLENHSKVLADGQVKVTWVRPSISFFFE